MKTGRIRKFFKSLAPMPPHIQESWIVQDCVTSKNMQDFLNSVAKTRVKNTETEHKLIRHEIEKIIYRANEGGPPFTVVVKKTEHVWDN